MNRPAILQGGATTVFRVRLSEQDSQLLEASPGFFVTIQACDIPANPLGLSTGRIEEALDAMLRFPISDANFWRIKPLDPP